ncbi:MULTISPECIES: hypothetical protein [Bacillus]|uniref:hypothetical protein n=1 Tax=Bacillus TaxID=1386 RepID=UPI001574723F|nr:MULTISPECIES: hypothetical protein [Bacillus]MBC6975131.1 hypothetical protein [Bacillus sp. Xin]MBY0600359.1 hypothetical protein [Bacillus bingmayongensis]NSW38460.1 hypothetical protein [Bacillus sp. Xin1]
MGKHNVLKRFVSVSSIIILMSIGLWFVGPTNNTEAAGAPWFFTKYGPTKIPVGSQKGYFKVKLNSLTRYDLAGNRLASPHPEAVTAQLCSTRCTSVKSFSNGSYVEWTGLKPGVYTLVINDSWKNYYFYGTILTYRS